MLQTPCLQTLNQRTAHIKVQAHSQQLDFYADATFPISLLAMEAKTNLEDEH